MSLKAESGFMEGHFVALPVICSKCHRILKRVRIMKETPDLPHSVLEICDECKAVKQLDRPNGRSGDQAA
jgi:hypothetical protein